MVLGVGKRLLADVSKEELRQIQARMRANFKPFPKRSPTAFQQKRLWSDVTINRHFAFLCRVLMLTVKDGSHLAPGYLRDAVNRGSLAGTVTKTVTTEKPEVGEKAEVVDPVVRPTGLEPVTPRSVVWCSIH